MAVFQKVPWSLLIIAYAVVAHACGIGMQGIAGYVFVGLCMLVLFVEFYKSADISPWAFLVNLIGVVVAVVLATTLMCYLVMRMGQAPTYFHWLGCAVIVGDAILSPFNAFRTALRNIGLGASG